MADETNDEKDAAGEAKKPEREPEPRRSASGPGLEWLLGGPAAALLAIVLFLLVNYLSARHYRRFDWTSHQLFTLSPRSREITRGLSGPVDMYILLGPRESQYSDVTELAERYSAEAPTLLHVHTIDPDRQRDRFLELTQRLGLRVGRTSTSDVASEAAIVLVRGEQHWEIAREALAGLGEQGDEESGAQGATARVTVERAISEGLARVDRNESTKLCLASGHGELALAGGDDSVSMLAAELRHDNVNLVDAPLRGNANVAADCDGLIIAGPRQAYTEGDADAVTRYLRAGGNVLMMLDPMLIDGRFAPTGLESVARLGGIDLTQSIVIENDAAHLIPDALPATFMVSEFGEHAITRSLRGSDARMLVITARALRRVDGSTVVPESLARTTPEAWGEVSTLSGFRDGRPVKDPNDIQGPVHIAMASQVPDVHPRESAHNRDAAGRIVVVGYSHLATNEAMSPGYTARFVDGYFVASALGWLSARRELVEIPARPASSAALNISQQDIRHIQLYTILLVPLAAALIGFAVARARRAP